MWGPTAPNPGWDRLTDRNQLVEKLKRSSIGPDSQLAKVDGICCSLRFLRVEILKGDTHSELMEKASHMLKVLQGWAEVEAAEEEIALLPGPEPG